MTIFSHDGNIAKCIKHLNYHVIFHVIKTSQKNNITFLQRIIFEEIEFEALLSMQLNMT